MTPGMLGRTGGPGTGARGGLRPGGRAARAPGRGLSVAVCALALQATAAFAADDAGKFAMKGAGFLPCQVYVSERDRRSDIYYMIGGWIEGYVSAHNKYVPDTYDVMSFESLELVLAVMEKHCRSHPEDRLYEVVTAIIENFDAQRLERESPRIRIEEGERKALLYRETISRMQAKLASLGLYQGPVDGRFTDATRSALMAFQSDIEFEPTGFPDQTTLWRLLRER